MDMLNVLLTILLSARLDSCMQQVVVIIAAATPNNTTHAQADVLLTILVECKAGCMHAAG